MKLLLLWFGLSLTIVSCQKDVSLNRNSDNVAKNSSIDASNGLMSQEKIKLFKSWSAYAYIYHGAYSKQKNFYAEVANLGYEKKVYVHHKMADGTWNDLALHYMKPASNNKEIWGLEYDYSNSISGGESPQDFGPEFYLTYEVNGQTYLDNNKGGNYWLGISEGMFLRDGLNVNADSYVTTFSKYPNMNTATFYVVADVRNIAYDKKVSVTYSTNGWQTSKTAPLSFATYYSIGNGVLLTNPNSFGIERWTATIAIAGAPKNIEYVISYKVNGQLYRDNNFGKKYLLPLTKY